ncbi:metal-binding protein ZinT [Macrococcus armenti]|uniref:metal-binding protein ZinT n=1 Tax=Macrococcus armenti TaxID=2875764 RepID=UPI001CD01F8E|nr:metal-binding protein ZinT [Macrococcus armenti]UBH09632.1 metal-binding protein ZinT [Macrococcus armenti]UBH11906.1 metal-binding protein ZinT [Macrococcus armenti]UBH16436.1 metal-binding protein ZinT [Macrococcus armenti]UBH18792.1 metal-binding protein ZinT [Macrococcus armenti]UBH21064.1 metal-binding protein ZinT [Macrococcus armenti]
MKKPFIISSAITLSVLLSGCNQDKEKDETKKTQTEQHEQKKEENSTHDHEHDHKHDHKHDHDHGHHMSDADKKVYEGYFDDSAVKDRKLTDWEGSWQSVYPFLKDGTLDEVFEHKAEDQKKTAEEVKSYYTTGYKTDVSHIKIGEKEITFTQNGEKHKGEYEYDGKEILTYEKGNRGVRYIFKRVSGDDKAPKFIQFSDHIIAPERALHFHIYMGDDRAELLKELENWPTYYPDDLSANDVKEEMLAH